MTKYIIVPAIALLLASCGQKNSSGSVAATDMLVRKLFIDSTKLRTMGIELGNPVRVGVVPHIFATGKVISLPNNEATISSCIDGRVEQVYVLPGQTIAKGQALMRISSIAFVEMQQQYLTACNDAEFMRLEYERQKELRSKDIGALADFQAIESKYKTILSQRAALGEKLKMLGVDPQTLAKQVDVSIARSYDLCSPIDGTVSRLSVSLGVNVSANATLAQVVNTGDMLAQVAVFEKDIDVVKPGKPVRIEFINQAVPSVNGTVQGIANTLDTEQRNVAVFVRFAKPSNVAILPEMSIKADIQGKPDDVEFTVPQTALFREQEFYYLFRATPTGTGYHFEKIKVQVEESDGKIVEISPNTPIAANELYVTKNVYLVNAEEQKE